MLHRRQTRRGRLHNSRRTVLLGLGIAALANLATAVWLERAPKEIRFAEAAALLARYRTLPASPDVIFFGSSASRSVLDLEVLARRFESRSPSPPRMFAAAVPAGDPATMLYLWDRITPAGRRPRLAIVELLPEVLVWPHPYADALISRLLEWSDLLANLPELVLARGTSRLLSTRAIPVHRYRRELLTWLTGAAPPHLRVPLPGGPVPAVGPGERTGRPVNRDALSGTFWSRPWTFRADGLAVRALRTLICRLSETGTAVVFLIPPRHSVLRSLETAEGWRSLHDLLAHLEAPPALIADYRDRLPDEMFVDHVHADTNGARAFSTMIADEVVGPWWERHADRRGPVSASAASPRR